MDEDSSTNDSLIKKRRQSKSDDVTSGKDNVSLEEDDSYSGINITNISNVNDDKTNQKSIPMETVLNDDDATEFAKNHKAIMKNESENIETEIDNNVDTTSKDVTSDKNDVEDNKSTSDSPKENDNEIKSQNPETESIENNYPSSSTNTHGQEEQNNTNSSNTDRNHNEDENTVRTGRMNRKYRLRVPSTSSDESPSASNTPIRRRMIFNIELISSSDSEPNSNSSRSSMLDDDDDNSNSTTSSNVYPEFDPNYSLSLSNSMSSNEEDHTNDSIDEILQPAKKPKYNWNSIHELMYREQGLSGNGVHSMAGRNAYSFQNRFYSARHVVEKLKVIHKLAKHTGCVNSLNFNKTGTLLATGSDDLKIIIWKWSSNKIMHRFSSGHNSNVFQAKFVDYDSGITIISSGRDGLVRRSNIRPSGSVGSSGVLYRHDGAVHKISLTPQDPNELLTAGEDGNVERFDFRERTVERLISLGYKVPLYSIAHHPFKPEFCICGQSQFVYIHDKRYPSRPVFKMCPKNLEDKESHTRYITCALYNNTGSEILASYNNDDIYLFNNICYIPGIYLHQYRGHKNLKTIKGVNFYGPNSEYIVSGSDCGHLFVWDKQTETIINWKRGDIIGVVNCLEPHPSFPILATSGIDYDAKIWAPLNEYPPSTTGLEKCVRHNMKRTEIFNDFLDRRFDDRALFSFLNHYARNEATRLQNRVRTPDDDEEICDTDTDEEDSNLRTLPCSPQ